MSERAEDERTRRGVHVEHGDDGMSWLSAYLPAFQAAAIDKRLTKEAKALGADDERNTQQRRADLLAAWTTTNESGEAAVGADIAVTISAEALAGVNDDPVIASDGSWTSPAHWIADLIESGETFWHRIITDPAGHTLDHTYFGRFATGVLAKAIAFRDGVCQAPGCCRSADAMRPRPPNTMARRPHHRGEPVAAVSKTSPAQGPRSHRLAAAVRNPETRRTVSHTLAA